MDLAEAVDTVLAHIYVESSADFPAREAIDEIRALGHEEIDDWIRLELLEPGEIEDAYHVVIAAGEDDIDAVFAAS